MVNKNVVRVVNDSDKNLGAAIADTHDVIKECKRQLYDVNTYLKLSMELFRWNYVRWLTDIKLKKVVMIKKLLSFEVDSKTLQSHTFISFGNF